MKKNGDTKSKKKVVYKAEPWGEDAPIIGEFVTDLLPPHVLKKAKIRVMHARDEVALELKDDKKLQQQAKKVGLSPEALMGAIIRDYLHGKLVQIER